MILIDLIFKVHRRFATGRAGRQIMLQAAQLIFKQGRLVKLDGILFDVIADKLIAHLPLLAGHPSSNWQRSQRRHGRMNSFAHHHHRGYMHGDAAR
ncbi:MAG TPA: hypothetical protein VIK35_05315 [Verrucomicrobiae bacterium]